MSLSLIASGLFIYSPLMVLCCFCHTCFCLGIDFENVKLDSIVMMTCLLLKDVTVVIVVDWDHKVFLIVFGLSFDVFVED
jgi:hypothetical protein